MLRILVWEGRNVESGEQALERRVTCAVQTPDSATSCARLLVKDPAQSLQHVRHGIRTCDVAYTLSTHGLPLQLGSVLYLESSLLFKRVFDSVRCDCVNYLSANSLR